MKAVLTLLGLIMASCLSGVTAVEVSIRAYSATGEVALGQDSVLRGTRLLLTCDVNELPEGSEITSYKWYHSCSTGRCEIQDGYPYYTAVSDTLLVVATSWEGRPRRHYCEVTYHTDEGRSGNDTGFTTLISLTDSTTLFIITPTSLLLTHSLITDVQQITGRNGQHWINCTSGRDGPSGNIYSAVDSVIVSSGAWPIGPGRRPSNRLYYCLAAGSPKYYFTVFLGTVRSSDYLPTPTVSDQDASMWTLTSPDGSRVERYIVEFECRVRNITFVEKYMSVSVSGGTGQVATSVSCFGGLGQLYRVKVWAVSGPNISRQPAVKLVNTVLTSTPTAAGGTWSPVIVSTSTRSGTPISTASGTPSSSSGLDHKKNKGDNTGSTFIGIGVGIFILFAVLGLVGLTVVVVMVVAMKRRATYKQKGKKRANSCYSSPVVVELSEKDLDLDYDVTVITEENGFNPYEDIDSKAQNRNAKTSPLKASSTPASATDVGELYAVVDMSKKKGVKKKGEEDGCIETNKDDLYTMPVKKKKNKVTDEGRGATGDAEKSEGYNDVPELRYEPKADSESGMKSEGDERSSNADMLYAVVDKSQKRKK